ncbi:MAG: hypothetical protein QHJ73_12860 [Armatimonadota bacterium]|nr:hypothetical protein [Armatimonadota bacterium]
MYGQDYDERFPWGIDIVDRYSPDIWDGFPEWKAFLASMPLMHDLVDPYVKSHGAWRCPSDIGGTYVEISSCTLDCTPTAYQRYGASYAYRTELSFRHITFGGLSRPAEVNVLADLMGRWHSGGSTQRRDYRYHVLYADWHVKHTPYDRYLEAWRVPVP